MLPNARELVWTLESTAACVGGCSERWRRTEMTAILGISAFYHDSAAAIVRDGQIW